MLRIIIQRRTRANCPASLCCWRKIAHESLFQPPKVLHTVCDAFHSLFERNIESPCAGWVVRWKVRVQTDLWLVHKVASLKSSKSFVLCNLERPRNMRCGSEAAANAHLVGIVDSDIIVELLEEQLSWLLLAASECMVRHTCSFIHQGSPALPKVLKHASKLPLSLYLLA